MKHAKPLKLLMALGAMLALSGAQAESATPPANVLSLSATASAEVTNDVLAITFSTQREGSDPAAVQSQLAQALNAALAEARKAANPGQVDISTGNFAVNPRYTNKGETLRWQGVAELRAEGKDFDSLAKLVGRIQTLSVSYVGYSLSREAREKVQTEVSAQAIARFRSQADVYAKAFGFSSVTLRTVEVQTSDGPISPMPRFRVAAAEMAAAPSLPVEAGRSSVSATVTGAVQMLR